MPILPHGCTTSTLTKRIEKKLDRKYTRKLLSILNKSGKQNPMKKQLYDYLPPISKTIQIRRRHAGHCWRSKDELMSDIFLWTLSHGRAIVSRPTRTYLRTQDVVWKTCLERWLIGTNGERESEKSVQAVQLDDDDEMINTICFGKSPWRNG